MSPFEQAAQVYQTEECARSLREDLEAHLLHGWVFSTPEVFLMARRVSTEWSNPAILHPWTVDDCGDCWHVWLAGGDLVKVLEMIPYPLPWVSFERGNVLRILRFETVIRRLRRFAAVD